MTWKMRNPHRWSAIGDYVKTCRDCEAAGRPDLIQKYSIDPLARAGQIWLAVAAMRRDLSRNNKENS